MFLSSLKLNKAAMARQASYLLLQRPGCCWFSTTDDFQFGTVKKFMRKKAYGFIVPDSNHSNNNNNNNNHNDGVAKPNDIFVHNSGIKGTERVASALYPYLQPGDRVRYTVVAAVDANGAPAVTAKPQASQVTFEDGAIIPMYRKEYVETASKYEMTKFGQTVNGILMDEAIDNKLESILEAHTHTAAAVAVTQERYDYFNQYGSYANEAASSNDEETSPETSDAEEASSEEEEAKL